MKAKFERSKPYVNTGATGHVDHSRTTFTAAITRVLYDKHPDLNELRPFDQVGNVPEKRECDATINVSHIEYQTKKRHYAHIDISGYVDCVKNMITDVAQMDDAILVVATTDDPMAQTRKYVLLTRQAGVPTILVAPNRSGMADDEEMLELVEGECRDLLESQNFDRDVLIIKVSTLKVLESDEGWVGKIVELMDAVDEFVPTPERDMGKPFLMPTKDIFIITGRGTVVTGCVEHGKLPINSEVEILGIRNPQKTTATDIEMSHKSMDEAWADKNCGLPLRGTRRDEVKRGQVVAVPSPITPHTNFTDQVYVLKKEEGRRHSPFFSNHRPQFYFRTMDMTGVITFPEGTDMVMPGDTTEITVEFIQPIAMEPGLGFAIREGDRTIGSGRVTATEK